MDSPVYFRDAMLKGDFKRFEHEHFFQKNAAGTLMKDIIVMEAPYGLAGRIFNRVFLKGYIRHFLEERNESIRHFAESGEWKKILNQHE